MSLRPSACPGGGDGNERVVVVEEKLAAQKFSKWRSAVTLTCSGESEQGICYGSQVIRTNFMKALVHSLNCVGLNVM